jgi:hypothetical protein
MASNRDDNSWLVLLFFGGLILYGVANRNSDNAKPVSTPNALIASPEPRTISRDDALSNHWDEVCDYISGTEEIEACVIGGGCYALEADIIGCNIDTVYFANGGFLDVSAPIDEYGNASTFDTRGRLWDFTLDMQSFIVDEALEDWASRRSLIVEQ